MTENARSGTEVDQADVADATVIGTKCPTRVPEPHWLGEFPMTCYRCHIEADS